MDPGARLVAAIAPALTIGLVRPPERSTAVRELNGSPVPLAPSFSRASSAPTSSQTSAKTNGFDTLMMVNARSASPAVKRWPFVPATQMPKRSAGTFASAGYTSEVRPSRSAANRACASSTQRWTVSGGGRRPVET